MTVAKRLGGTARYDVGQLASPIAARSASYDAGSR
jgi:hypothetical protein